MNLTATDRLHLYGYSNADLFLAQYNNTVHLMHPWHRELRKYAIIIIIHTVLPDLAKIRIPIQFLPTPLSSSQISYAAVIVASISAFPSPLPSFLLDYLLNHIRLHSRALVNHLSFKLSSSPSSVTLSHPSNCTLLASINRQPH